MKRSGMGEGDREAVEGAGLSTNFRCDRSASAPQTSEPRRPPPPLRGPPPPLRGGGSAELPQSQLPPLRARELCRHQGVGLGQPVSGLRSVHLVQVVEADPFRPREVGGRAGAAGLGQGFEGDVADLEGNPTAAGDRKYAAAHLVDIVRAPLDDGRDRRQGAAGGVKGLRAQASTPRPMGQTTPVPPTPQ
jgi:hypothetical protein